MTSQNCSVDRAPASLYRGPGRGLKNSNLGTNSYARGALCTSCLCKVPTRMTRLPPSSPSSPDKGALFFDLNVFFFCIYMQRLFMFNRERASKTHGIQVCTLTPILGARSLFSCNKILFAHQQSLFGSEFDFLVLHTIIINQPCLFFLRPCTT